MATVQRKSNFSHIYMHELACIHDWFTLQNRVFNAKYWPQKNHEAKSCCKRKYAISGASSFRKCSLLVRNEFDWPLNYIWTKAIGVAMLLWPLVSFWDLFAAGKTENQQISCLGTASGATKKISLGSNTPTDLSPIFLAGNGIGKISTQCCMKIAQRTNN